jgi:hypothetical protein
MRENFQETIHQRTDEELMSIAKDMNSYSVEERLVAIAEQQARKPNGGRPIASSAKRVYSIGQIWFTAFMATPLVAGYLVAQNFETFNDKENANNTWYIAVSLLIAYIGIPLWFAKKGYEPLSTFIWLLLGVVNAIVAYRLTTQYQKENITAFIELGGKKASWWGVFGVYFLFTVLVFLIALMVMVIGSFFMI